LQVEEAASTKSLASADLIDCDDLDAGKQAAEDVLRLVSYAVDTRKSPDASSLASCQQLLKSLRMARAKYFTLSDRLKSSEVCSSDYVVLCVRVACMLFVQFMYAPGWRCCHV
jgi:hypothetical protein